MILPDDHAAAPRVALAAVDVLAQFGEAKIAEFADQSHGRNSPRVTAAEAQNP